VVSSFLAQLGKLLSGASVRWVSCEPIKTQRIYFANHTSHLDFVVLWSALPRELRAITRPVAAKDYWERGKIRHYVVTRVFNGVLIERGHTPGPRDNPDEIRNSARDTIDKVAEGFGDHYSLIIFPEGTRGTGEYVKPFKSGLYHLCRRRPDIELVPVYLENLNRILPKGAFLPVPLLSSVTFGPPLRFQDGEDKAEFLKRTHTALCSLKSA
jgi:1-acyl-sn-glycerol-3-phosphate acyltransferase